MCQPRVDPNNVRVFDSGATHDHESCGCGDPILVHGLDRPTESGPDQRTGDKRTTGIAVVDQPFGEVGVWLRSGSACIDRGARAAARAG